MKEFVEYIVKNMVQDPSSVEVRCSAKAENSWSIEMRVAKDDVGKVVGRGGQTIKALRLLAMIVSSRIGQKVELQLVED